MSLLRLSTQTLVAALILFSAGCKDREITAYRAPKESPAAAPHAAHQPAPSSGELPPGHPPIGSSTNDGGAIAPDGSAMGSLPGTAIAQGNALTWTAPEHWRAKAPGSVRKGSYAIVGDGNAVGDLGITAFPGDTGGLHANINRWRGQIGLAPASNADVEKSIERFTVNGLQIDFVEMVGPAGIRLLGGIVPHNAETWFFKLTGPDALIAGERDAFREFLNTIQVR